MKLNLFWATAFSSLVVIFGLVAAWLELAPFFEGRGTPAQNFVSTYAAPPSMGWSHYSQNLTLVDCAESLSSLYGRAQPSNKRERVETHCEGAVQQVLAMSPLNGLAWHTKALIAASRHDAPTMNAALATSRRVTPNEQWVAQLRVQLAMEQADNLDASSVASENDDLAVLVRSARGIRVIATRYVNDEMFREKITRIVEGLSAQDQQRFLASVRQAAR